MVTKSFPSTAFPRPARNGLWKSYQAPGHHVNLSSFEAKDKAPEEKLVTITPKYDPATKRARIGISFTGSLSRFTATWSAAVGSSPGCGPENLWHHLRADSQQANRRQTKRPQRPVGILSILATQVKEDYRLALSFLVLLNINLAIINLLPIPVLDGGHIMMSILEKIRRRPLSPRFVEYTTTGFAILLICFMGYITIADIKRFSLFRAMFRNGIQIEEPQNQKDSVPPASAPVPAAPR